MAQLVFGVVVLFLYFGLFQPKIQGALENYFSFTKSLRIRLLAIFLKPGHTWLVFGDFYFFDYFNGLAVFLSFCQRFGLVNRQSSLLPF